MKPRLRSSLSLRKTAILLNNSTGKRFTLVSDDKPEAFQNTSIGLLRRFSFLFGGDAFLDDISASEDDFKLAIRVDLDAFDHLADDGVVILKTALLSLCDYPLDLVKSVVWRVVGAGKLLNGVDAVLKERDSV